jgi:hypothetical protein
MRTFAESLAALDAVAVQPELEPTSDSVHDLVRAGVSHQFASALHRVLDEDSWMRIRYLSSAPVSNGQRAAARLPVVRRGSRYRRRLGTGSRSSPAS